MEDSNKQVSNAEIFVNEVDSIIQKILITEIELPITDK
jgi:hypothetical protein